MTSSTSSASPTPVIVGCSVAALLIIVIVASSLWCWKTGKCCKYKKNESVIEQNEMYGTPVDYNQYEHDAYDTKVVDNNDYYYDNE